MIFQQLISKNIAFAVYRMPDQASHVLMVQEGAEVEEMELSNLDARSGFVMAPYESYRTGKAFLLHPSFTIIDENDKKAFIKWLEKQPSNDIQCEEVKAPAVTKAEYLKQVGSLVEKMQQKELQKVVLSRVTHEILPENFQPDAFIHQLEKDYPKAFVYLFFLPGKGLWCGATPETLIKKEENLYQTMSLAGTQLKPEGDEKITWESKERQEQEYVTRFIDEQLRELQITSYTKSQPETVFAGKLAHLCTRFQISGNQLTGKAGALVQSLHPTPAICGLPREKAAQIIDLTEMQHRDFYTGFLGPWNMNNTTHLFVNLRCAKILKKELEVYVGGGLTADSIAEREWDETRHKSQTMLTVLEKIRKFAP